MHKTPSKSMAIIHTVCAHCVPTSMLFACDSLSVLVFMFGVQLAHIHTHPFPYNNYILCESYTHTHSTDSTQASSFSPIADFKLVE